MRFRRMNWAGYNFASLPNGWRHRHLAMIAAYRHSDLIGAC
jgi:hypothetical protein